MREMLIAGGGPAGAAAAIAGRLDGASVRLLDRAVYLRHKVCGEFLSPGAAEILRHLKVWDEFLALGPRLIRRYVLHLGNRSNCWNLMEQAWGVSRLALDGLLLDKAARLGAAIERGAAYSTAASDRPPLAVVLACGRRSRVTDPDRLFGFKTHFEGPGDDAVELYFDSHGYVGVSGVEDGLTNVCGIAPETLLQRFGFDFDRVITRSRPLAERIGPLRRSMRWIVTGPLSFSSPSAPGEAGNVYPAGDALGFVDPFTGTGIMNALLTGRLAGMAAARGVAASEYVRRCRGMLGRPFLVSSVLRRLAACTQAHFLAPWLPGNVLFRCTRAAISDGRML